MSTKPKLFLLDAVVVIELHRLGLWTDVVERAEVFLPSIVAMRESQYWKGDDGTTQSINLEQDAGLGRIRVIEADAAEMSNTLDAFDVVMQQSIDPGELEALTILRRWDEPAPPSFCTADYKAIEATCLLGFDRLCVSLEAILERVGLSRTLDEKFSSKSLKLAIKRALVAKVQGIGLSHDHRRRS